MRTIPSSAVLSALLLALLLPLAASDRYQPAVVGVRKFVIDDDILAPLAEGLLRLQGGPAQAPDARFPLVLAAERTSRPDMLNKFRRYRGGWDITNKHYWASLAFTGAAGFVLAFLWFVLFGFGLGAYHCCKWGTGTKEKVTFKMQCICFMLLLVFTFAAATGCILLSVGQNEFHDEVLNTLVFVVNQSDFTVQILRNVTGFLSYGKTVNVAGVYLPSDVQNEIDKLNIELSDAARILTEETNENSAKVRGAIYDVWCTLIAVAILMLLLAILGFVLSFLGHKHAIYIFIISGWLLVAVTFVLCGVFLILNNAVGDTCTAMDEWAHYPQAETALSNILPCVDERRTNVTLYQSRFVVYQLVTVINTVIQSIANSNTAPWDHSSFFYNQSGPLIPSLCSPYDSQLRDQPCKPQEVSFTNASVVWQNYTCMVSESDSCTSPGRITPEIYNQLVMAVNVSYGLDHYTPLLLSLRGCSFVRETFLSITTQFCPFLKHDLRLVSAELALISTGVMLCLMLWIFYANRPQREEVFVKLPEIRVCRK